MSMGVSANNIRHPPRRIRTHARRVPVLVLGLHAHHSNIFQKSNQSIDNGMVDQRPRPLSLLAITLVVITVKLTLP
eukprot:COSAG06_NODE_8974_length_2021_cov_1.662331_3_plen_76_part_00